MNQEIVRLHDRYMEEAMDRRSFLTKLAHLTGSAAAATALLPWLDYNLAHAATISPDDPRLSGTVVACPGTRGDIRAYFVRKKTDAKQPGVVVIHENRGLNPHIEDVARRLAMEGFTALAPDALSPLGGTPSDPDLAREMIQGLDPGETVENFTAAVRYLKTHPQTTGRVGVIGFCWGGAMANQLAVKSPDIQAAVPFYGMQPAAADVPRIKAALVLHYAGLDDRINQGIPAFEHALKSAGIDYRLYMYKGANHAFYNDTNPSRYHPEAAALAWKRTIAFLTDKLKE